jgi:hypothetical protein
MYVFTCSKGHKSHSASKEQRDMSCPACGEPTKLDQGLVIITETVVKKYGQDTSRNWSPDQDINALFLRTVQNFLNDRLQARGFVFLNDVYNELGMRLTSQGAISGWLKSRGNSIQFASPEPEIDEEGAITLIFVTDGIIYDKIEEEQS